MHKETETTTTKAIKRNMWQISQESSQSEGETVNHYTLFVIGAATFAAGFWGLTCLANVLIQNGPLNMLRQLTAAVTGI